jgi:hypothetical protein
MDKETINNKEVEIVLLTKQYEFTKEFEDLICKYGVSWQEVRAFVKGKRGMLKQQLESLGVKPNEEKNKTIQ